MHENASNASVRFGAARTRYFNREKVEPKGLWDEKKKGKWIRRDLRSGQDRFSALSFSHSARPSQHLFDSHISDDRISLSSGLMRQFQSVRHLQANSCKLNAPNYTRMARRTELFTLYARDSIFVKWNTSRTHVLKLSAQALKLKTFCTPFHRPALSLLLPWLVSGPSSPRPVSKSTSPPRPPMPFNTGHSQYHI